MGASKLVQKNIATDELLLEYKKNDSIKRLVRAGLHTYNNIFSSVIGLLDMIVKHRGKKNYGERQLLLEELLQRGVRQTDLLYGFASERPLVNKTFSADAAGEKAIKLLNSLSRKHSFTKERIGKIVPRLYGNSNDIVLLLFYLGENSVDFMEEGGAVKLILSEVSLDDQRHVCFRMIDSGSGISADIQSRIFKPFATSHANSLLKGLGLFAAHRIVQNHKGKITLASRPEGGTEAAIWLPAATDSDDRQVRNDRPELLPEKKALSSITPQVFLVVDDELAMRKMLSNGLKRRGHAVHSVDSCSKAVEFFRQHHKVITCILLDMQLGDSDGAACAETLREISCQPMLIFMSGSGDTEGKERLASCSFLKKPFALNELERMIKQNNE